MTVPTAGPSTSVARALLEASGVPPEAADRTARVLVLADAWGIHSHGLMRLPYYLQRLADGGCNPRAGLRTTTDTGPLVVLDGEDGLGHWQAWHAAELARDRCAQLGVAVVAVSASSHCGALGAYTVPLVEAGMLGIVFSNGPAVMPPWNGSAPVLSTSPIAAGIPCRPRPAIVDLATSAVARGRIKAAAQRGEPIEEGWAFTADGEPTTDAAQALAGMLAPLGGVKGFALAFLVESLTAGLVGPSLSTDVPDMFAEDETAKAQGIAHLVVALDPARFDPSGARSDPDRLDRLASEVQRAGGRLPGARRVMPDEITPDGEIAVDADTWEQLRLWEQRLSVAHPSLDA